MTKFVYDEDASERLHMDVVHEMDDTPTPAARWVDAMRQLSTINDPLARRLLALHRDCGSGTGVSPDDASSAVEVEDLFRDCHVVGEVETVYGAQVVTEPGVEGRL